MQFFTTLATLALALVGTVSAMPSAVSNSQCDTGALKCCQQVQSADSAHMMPILGALGILNQVTGNTNVGTDCTPINVIAAGGSQSCTSMPVCCNGNSFGGLSLGCSPIPVII